MNDMKFFTFLTLCAAALSPLASSPQSTITFALGSDFHAADVPSGDKNLQAFVDAAKASNADFMIELGDFCRLDSASQVYRDIWGQFDGDKYHVVGNHDMDSYSPEEYTAGMGMPGRYYSFDKGDFHFIVLDGNNLFDGKNFTHYSHANYYTDPLKREFVDPEQMKWLEADLAATDKKCVIFSHQSIDACMGNGREVRKILEKANEEAGMKKVVLAFSGHNHSNYLTEINGIRYMQINSGSYVWVGDYTGSDRRYSPEINRRYTLMPYSLTFDAPLYAIVTLTPEGAVVKGTKARFLPPLPEELGLPTYVEGFPLVSEIEDAVIRF